MKADFELRTMEPLVDALLKELDLGDAGLGQIGAQAAGLGLSSQADTPAPKGNGKSKTKEAGE